MKEIRNKFGRREGKQGLQLLILSCLNTKGTKRRCNQITYLSCCVLFHCYVLPSCRLFFVIVPFPSPSILNKKHLDLNLSFDCEWNCISLIMGNVYSGYGYYQNGLSLTNELNIFSVPSFSLPPA